MEKSAMVKFLACALLLTGCSGGTDQKDEQKKSKDSEASLKKTDVSYALGYNVGDVLNKTDPDLSLTDLVKGIQDAYTQSKSPRMDEGEIKKTLMLYNVELSKSMKEKQESQREDNLKKGAAFVADYAKQQGVKKDPSGLYYKVIKKGDGPTPKKDDVVVVEYTGKKLDGKEFFSTKEQGQPAQFTVSNVIKGWSIALQEMPEGSTWEIVVPPELAYGDRGAAEVIGPGETLMFEIQLLKIKDKNAGKEAAGDQNQ